MRRRYTSFGGPARVVSPLRRVRRRVGGGLTAAGVRRGALLRAGRFASRASRFGGAAYLGYEALRFAKNRYSKNRARRQIGEAVGSGGSKRLSTDYSLNLATRTLYSEPLLQIPKGTQIDDRTRDVINFRGVKICASIVNKSTTGNGEKMFWNMAVISPKAENHTAGVSTTSFFRGNGATRTVDFSTALTAIDFRCLPINTDNWIILKHKRMTLAPFSSTEGLNGRVVEFYLPLKRQIRYENAGSNPAGKEVFLVWWLDKQDTAGGTALTGNVADWQLKINRFFREPKN